MPSLILFLNGPFFLKIFLQVLLAVFRADNFFSRYKN